ncbi:MAG: hypothetical protein LBL66_06435 [Clostridiales bacterium]|jgi:hypothetical protein|nr:hypothetical protein [Clostridiales bacterium]
MKRYGVTVPVKYLREEARDYCTEDYASLLRQFGADRLLVSFSEWNTDPGACVREFRRISAYYAERGVETGIWIPGIRFSDMPEGMEPRVFEDGSKRFGCPFGARFSDYYAGIIAYYAGEGVNFILLDDSFQMQNSGGRNCFCDLHMEKYGELLGEDISRERFVAEIANPKPNRYRTAWIEGSAAGLFSLARKIRERVDAVNKAARVGLCESTTIREIDGADLPALARALAGGTRPFVRLHGGPYGYCMFRSPSDWNSVADIERLLIGSFAGSDAEIVSEGDTFPRPRYATPAAHLENFDGVLRADGRFGGILKYGIDYISAAGYERGYAEAAGRDKKIFAAIEKYFADGADCGYYAYEYTGKEVFTENEFPDDVWNNRFRSVAGHLVPYTDFRHYTLPSPHLLNSAGMPHAFTPTGGPAVVCGVSARHIPLKELARGAVLDLNAARILTERGVDVGLVSAVPAVSDGWNAAWEASRVCECHADYGDNALVGIWVRVPKEFFKIETAPSARHLSHFLIEAGRATKRQLASYRYENKDGLRFYVLCYDVWENAARDVFPLSRNYLRQRGLADAYEWLCGQKPDALCLGHPDLYTAVKKSEGYTAVGLWNNFSDRIDRPEILLGGRWERAKFINCRGKLEGDKATLSVLYPYQFAGAVFYK